MPRFLFTLKINRKRIANFLTLRNQQKYSKWIFLRERYETEHEKLRKIFRLPEAFMSKTLTRYN